MKLLAAASVVLASALVVDAQAPVQVAGRPSLPPETGGIGLMATIELMLALDPNIAIEATFVELSRGALMVESSRFDTTLSSGLSRTDTELPNDETTSSESESLDASAGAFRELRTGLTLEPGLTLSQTEETGLAETVNLGTVSFSLRQPLLRDRGRAAVTAGERSAGRRLSAADLDLRHRVAERVRTVAGQYWRVVAAQENLEILRTTEDSTRTFLDTNRKLVAADVRPEADLVLLEADLADKESATRAGEQSLFEARRTLALEIGLAPDQMERLPLPSDPLPERADGDVPPHEQASRFVGMALRQRADLRAARLRLESDEILLSAADNALRPRLDLVVTPSWTGLVEGDDFGALLSSGFRNVPGLSSTVGLTLSLPLGNLAARGARIQTEAGRRASELTVGLFERRIGAAVPIALDAVRQSLLQLDYAQRAADLFARAVTNEETKLRAGRSTLIDVINQRDRLTAARQTLVSARLNLALALLDLRFETGTLLAEAPLAEEPEDVTDPGRYRLDPDQLVTVPQVEP